MPFNGSGSYSAPTSSWNPAVPNTAITSEDWNALLSDLSLALTACITKDGQSTTSARIPFAVGVSATGSSAVAVAYARSDDTDTGVYFPAANTVGLSAGGSPVLTADNSAITVGLPVLNLTVVTAFTLEGNATIGTATGDTLTVESTSEFNGPVTFNGTTEFLDVITVPNASFSNAKLANMATQTIKGRTTAGAGAPEDLTATQATAILNAFTGDSGSGGVKGLVPAPAAGDGAAGKILAADGTWIEPYGEIAAWARIDGTTVTAGRNVASVANSPTGTYTVTFTSAIGSTNYAVFVTVNNSGVRTFYETGTLASGSVQILFSDNTGSPSNVPGFFIQVLA